MEQGTTSKLGKGYDKAVFFSPCLINLYAVYACVCVLSYYSRVRLFVTL